MTRNVAVRMRNRGRRAVILGRDFLTQNNLTIDYTSRICRYNPMAYDILTMNPLTGLQDVSLSSVS